MTTAIEPITANANFKEWTRSQAFHLSLCGWAITELLIFADYRSRLADGDEDYGLSLTLRSTSNYLSRRGLIERCRLPGCQGNWVLTEAGRLVAELLRCAGFELPK